MNESENKILQVFKKGKGLSSGDIFGLLSSSKISQVTIKRYLSELVKDNYLERVGKGRSIKYLLTYKGIFLKPFDLREYLNIPENLRGGQSDFNFDLLKNLSIDVFTKDEKKRLKEATVYYDKNKKEGSDTIHKKELERFVIELSWKSSKIEGNTYTLLDTELLLKEGLRSNKNTESETQMIINHKKAFDYIFQNNKYFEEISIKKIEEVHFLLTDELGIKRNLRKSPVGVTGTVYRPLDNEYQIREALEALVENLNQISDQYLKAFFAILCISYIQPFEDGNKRTGRLLGNAVLLSGGLAPLSYRNVDEAEYRQAFVIFYEQNSIEAFKKIFIEQYIFSANNYNLGEIK